MGNRRIAAKQELPPSRFLFRAIVAEANLQAVQDSTANEVSLQQRERAEEVEDAWESRDGRPKSNPICASAHNPNKAYVTPSSVNSINTDVNKRRHLSRAK